MFLFLPISDENPAPRKPLLTWSIIGLNIIVFIYQMSLSNYDNQLLVNEYGVRPSVFSEFTNLHTLITSAFLHGGFMHLMSNMLFLYIYGDNIEAYLGRTKFLIFYVFGGVAAALLQAIFSAGADVPMIGASGCIAAIMGAYFVLYPKARINVFFWIFIFIQFIKVPANIVIGMWILGQLISAAGNTYDGVAYFAHIGGFIFGYVGIKYFFKEYMQRARVITNYEEVADNDLPISRKNKSQGLSKNDRRH
jgi:membrane associated rhomboid family serine protease